MDSAFQPSSCATTAKTVSFEDKTESSPTWKGQRTKEITLPSNARRGAKAPRGGRRCRPASQKVFHYCPFHRQGLRSFRIAPARFFELKILWPVLWYQGDCQIVNLRQDCKRTEFTCLKVTHRASKSYGCTPFNIRTLPVFCVQHIGLVLPSKKSARSPGDLRRKIRVDNMTSCHDS